MSGAPFRVIDIEWEPSVVRSPAEVFLQLPGRRTSMGRENLGPNGFTADFTDNDRDDYEPGEEAEEAFAAEWDTFIRDTYMPSKALAAAFEADRVVRAMLKMKFGDAADVVWGGEAQ